jgi:hypothetical protein
LSQKKSSSFRGRFAAGPFYLRLPNPDRAVVDTAKLQTYLLDPTHPLGKHKALVFAAVLGLTHEHAAWLRERLLAAAHYDAALVAADRFGVRYAIDFEVQTTRGSAIVRSGWIVRVLEDFPRLTTCFVLKRLSKRYD